MTYTKGHFTIVDTLNPYAYFRLNVIEQAEEPMLFTDRVIITVCCIPQNLGLGHAAIAAHRSFPLSKIRLMRYWLALSEEKYDSHRAQ